MSTVDTTKDKIREAYDNLTKSEQQVADYFLENTEISDFSSKHISLLLYVSEATLSRFAKKCGFKGYREFVYMYELDFKDYFTEKEEKEISDITRSVRKNYKDIMVKAFEIAGYDEEVVKEKFGALYHAFQYGAPPHAGMAPGIDRIVMLLTEEENIREVIVFPLNSNAEDLMFGSPTEVTEQQLREVHVKIR